VNILIPFLDRPRAFTYRYVEEDPNGRARVVTCTSPFIDLPEQVLDFPKQSVITSDNVVMEINAILSYWVVDAIKAIYQVANFAEAIEKLTQTTLRNVIGERRRRAQLLEAEANKASAILNAEGAAEAQVRDAQVRKEAAVLKAQGNAEAIQAMAVGALGAVGAIKEMFNKR